MNELYNGPIQIGEDKVKKNKLKKTIITFSVFILILFLFFTLFPTVNFLMRLFPNVGEMEFVEIDGVKIPTLYKYTKYDDTAISMHNLELSEGGISVKYSVIFCKSEIPESVKNTYSAELIELGYDYVRQNGVDFYALNMDNNSKFIYVMLSNDQIKYGICFSGRYEEILRNL